MGRKDLRFLKQTLAEIYTTNKEVLELKNKKKESSKQISNNERQMEKIISRKEQNIENLNFPDINKLKVVELKSILANFQLPQSGLKQELVDRIMANKTVISSLSGMESESSSEIELRKKLDELKKTEELEIKRAKVSNFGSFDPVNGYLNLYSIITIAALIFGLYILSSNISAYHDDNPFDCKNGETIHGSKVLDGEDDCSNGHDEKDPIFSTSDAQNYQSEEPFLIGLFLSCCIPIVIAFSIYSAKETFHNNKLEILQKELSGAEARVKKVEDRLNMKIQLRKLEESRQRKIKNDNVKIKGLEKKIEEEKEYFESIKVKIKTLEQKKKELYDSISHLIPYSDLI